MSRKRSRGPCRASLFAGACAIWGAGATACTESELVSSVFVLDPVDGRELDGRSRVGESGYVRVGTMPAGRDDLLAWQEEGGLALRQDGEWREIDVGAHEVAFGPVSGSGLPEIFGGAGDRALVWSAEDGSVLGEVESLRFPWDAVAADWDGDGDTDLVLSAVDGGAGFHARDADGLAELQPILESVGLDQHMDAADLDGDGRLDLVRHFAGDLDVVFGGPGGSTDEVFQIGVELDDIEKIVIGDLTGDGKPDVVVGARDGTQVFENGGDRSLTPGPSLPDMVSRMVVMDFDGDGDLDILAQPPRDEHDDYGNEVFVVRNDDGSLSAPEPLFELPELITDMAAGKDSDGNPWLAVSAFTFRSVRAPLEHRY